MTGKSFPGLPAAEDTRPTLERLKAFFFAFGRLALAHRMNAARTEIERGRERLWLGAADEEKTHQIGAVYGDIAPDETGKSSDVKHTPAFDISAPMP
jgi:hypothetical protein